MSTPPPSVVFTGSGLPIRAIERGNLAESHGSVDSSSRCCPFTPPPPRARPMGTTTLSTHTRSLTHTPNLTHTPVNFSALQVQDPLSELLKEEIWPNPMAVLTLLLTKRKGLMMNGRMDEYTAY